MLKHPGWLLSVWFVAACGGGIGSDDLLAELEDAQCDILVECEGIEDAATCDAAVILGGTDLETTLAAVEDGTVTYDEDAAQDCIDGIRDQGCSFTGLHGSDPCEDVFQGTVAPGGACFVDFECAGTGLCEITDEACDPELACCPGTCQAGVAISQVGGPCDDELNACADNLYCKPGVGVGAGTCATPVSGDGTACDEIDGCVNPFYCNLDFTTGMGTCKRPAGTGAACDRGDLLPCTDSRDYCDPTSLTCVRSATIGATCGEGVSCVDYASCIAGTCVADLKLGAACNETTGAPCAGTLDCTNGTCQAPPVGLVCP